MPSPFPGMNPYLEQDDCWVDFHGNFMYGLRAMLDQSVGPNYFVKVETRLILHELSAKERQFFGIADVGVVTDRPPAISEASMPTLNAPVKLTLPAVQVEKQHSVEIREQRSRRVVTVIELLSPSNKVEPGREDYLAKRRQIIVSPTHFIEIDLRRGGQRPSPPELPVCDYYVLLRRAEEGRKVGLWPIGLREPLPIVPIPLSRPDPDISLDLMAVLNQVYDRGGYGRYIYQGTPEPALSAIDQEWAKSVLTGIVA